MSKKPKKPWLESNGFLRVLSIFIALLFWVLVALTNPDGYSQVFRKIAVDAAPQSATLTSLGLDSIEISPLEVDAVVYGEMGVVSRLKSEDLTATIEIPANLTAAGTYDLNLVLAGRSGAELQVEYAPKRVRVRLDRTVQKSFDVETAITGLVVPQGYILQEKITVSPGRVEVSGPQAELDKIARCVIRADFSGPVERTFADEFPILLLDAQGDVVDPDERHLTLSSASAQMIVTVLREKELPLIVEFTNVPRGFPMEELGYSLSSYEVMVAGPADMMDRYQELIVGFIDLREVSAVNRSFTFDIELPASQLISLDGENRVTLAFHLPGWDQAVFNLEDILLVNQPARYEVQLLSSTLQDVVITGEREILQGLTADDIVAEVDLSDRELVEGQQRYPVKISIPGKGLVWATGEYSAVIQVS